MINRPHPSALLLAVLVILSTNLPVRATVIIAAIYGDRVYLASDSKITYTGSPPENVPHTFCKIRRTATKAFACAALATDNSGTDLIKTIAQLAVPQGSIKQWIAKSDKAISVTMPRLLSNVQQRDPAHYASTLGRDIVECAFASWESNQPVLIEDIWSVDANGKLQHERLREVSVGAQNTLLIGQTYAIQKHGPIHSGGLTIPTVLENLINLEIDAETRSPDPQFGPTVGPPVSILRIDSTGTHWERKGICESP